MKNNSISLLVLGAFLLGLSSCADAPAPKKAHVVSKTVVHTLDVTDSKLDDNELREFDNFLDGISATALAKVDIKMPDNLKSKKLTRSIYSHLATHNISERLVQVHSVERNEVIAVDITYSQIILAGPCPDWSKSSTLNYENTGFSNFGCTTENNIAAQLTYPQDLDRGNGSNVYDAARDSVKIGQYISNTAAGGGGTSTTSSASSGTQ